MYGTVMETSLLHYHYFINCNIHVDVNGIIIPVFSSLLPNSNQDIWSYSLCFLEPLWAGDIMIRLNCWQSDFERTAMNAAVSALADVTIEACFLLSFCTSWLEVFTFSRTEMQIYHRHNIYISVMCIMHWHFCHLKIYQEDLNCWQRRQEKKWLIYLNILKALT